MKNQKVGVTPSGKFKKSKVKYFWTYGLLSLFIISALLVIFIYDDYRFMDLWLTADQQGRYYFEQADFEQAAERFADPFWKGSAYYRAGNYDQAVNWFVRSDSAAAYYNMGNSYAMLGSYEQALESYDQALQRNPDWPEARENRELIAGFLKKDEKEEEDGVPQQPIFSADEIKFDDKGKKGKEGEVPLEKMSEKQIAEMWLRRLQTSPADFLRQKFIIQSMMQSGTTRTAR